MANISSIAEKLPGKTSLEASLFKFDKISYNLSHMRDDLK